MNVATTQIITSARTRWPASRSSSFLIRRHLVPCIEPWGAASNPRRPKGNNLSSYLAWMKPSCIQTPCGWRSTSESFGGNFVKWLVLMKFWFT